MRNSHSKNIYSGRVIQLTLDTTVLPNQQTVELEIIHHPGGAAVVVVNDQNQVCLIKQYRYVVQDWIWELPAGKIDNEEDPLETARRELIEETGVRANKWRSLGTYLSSPGVFKEVVHLYLAQDIEYGQQEHGHDEVIEIHWVDLELARTMALDNTINDGKSALALLRAYDILDTPT